MAGDELALEDHFAFGRNWSNFARSVTEEHLDAAVVELVRLLGRNELNGLSFLDLGCGSGLHAVAAARCGAQVTAVDIDPVSVQTTELLAERFGVRDRVSTRVASVFEISPEDGRFDIVYSWGVLHHTGDMWEAIRRATELVTVESSGEIALALYRRTRFCGFWRWEKRLYSQSPAPVQWFVRLFYTVATDAARLRKGVTPKRHRSRYFEARGMEAKYDVHDWLGGYPYESASPPEVRALLFDLGFEERAAFVHSDSNIPWQPFGPGCDEYRFARISG